LLLCKDFFHRQNSIKHSFSSQFHHFRNVESNKQNRESSMDDLSVCYTNQMRVALDSQAPANTECKRGVGCKSLDSFNHTSMIPENPLHRKGSRATSPTGT
jgi:hypothetical protein